MTMHGLRMLLSACVLTQATPGVAETLRLAPGATADFTLAENPSTGFSWRIDAARSRGVGQIVAVTDAGFTHANSAMLGAPGVRRWTLRGLRQGRAALSFVYMRPWEPTPALHRRLAIEVSRP